METVVVVLIVAAIVAVGVAVAVKKGKGKEKSAGKAGGVNTVKDRELGKDEVLEEGL